MHQQLKDWLLINGDTNPLTIGTRVKIAPTSHFFDDWQGTYYVVGIEISNNRSHTLNITIANDMSRAGAADGWSVDELKMAFGE